MDFFAQQESARRATRWLRLAFAFAVLIFTAATGLAIFLVCVLIVEDALLWAILGGMALGFVCISASWLKTWELRRGGEAVAHSLGGARVDRSSADPKVRRLLNVVAEMAIASRCVVPIVYVLEREAGINALSAGNSPADAVIVVTRGAVSRLSRDELQAVVAHEFSHILNGDMRLNSRLLGWVFGLLVVTMSMRAYFRALKSIFNHQGEPLDGMQRLAVAAVLCLYVFIPFAYVIMLAGKPGVFCARALQASVSRRRERLADASAVQFTRNPAGLRGALLKIAGLSEGSNLMSPHAEEAAHMLFAPGSSRWFSTHQPTHDRLSELGPRIKRGELRALADVAAREQEHHQQVEDEGAAVVVGRKPRELYFDRAQKLNEVLLQAAALDDVRVEFAASARQSSGPPDATPSSVHKGVDARISLLAMLRSSHPQVAATQDDILRRSLGDALLQPIQSQAARLAGLEAGLRLPTLLQQFSSLRTLAVREKQELRSVVNQLAMVDGRMEVFECCLLLLLEASIRDHLDGPPREGNASLLGLARPINLLVSIIASQAHDDRVGAEAAYAAGMAAVLPHHASGYAVVDDWARVLCDSMRALDKLRPSAKKVLFNALSVCISHDGKLDDAERDLLSTISSVLHHPLPPVLAATPAQ